MIRTVGCVTNLMCTDHISIRAQYNFGDAFALPLGVVMSFAYLIRQTKLTDVAQWTTQAHYIQRGLTGSWNW